MNPRILGIFPIVLTEDDSKKVFVKKHDLIFYIVPTHEDKGLILKKIKTVEPECFKEIGCYNPDIYIKSRKDDRVVLVPPKVIRNKCRKTKKITAVKASEVLGGDYKDKIPILKFMTYQDIEVTLRKKFQLEFAESSEKAKICYEIRLGKIVVFLYINK